MLLLTVTVCTVILATIYKFEFLPAGAMPDDGRKMFYDIIVFIVGLIGGYISHGDGDSNDKN